MDQGWIGRRELTATLRIAVANEIEGRRQDRFMDRLTSPFYRELRAWTGGLLGRAYRPAPDPYYTRPWWKNPFCWQYWRYGCWRGEGK